MIYITICTNRKKSYTGTTLHAYNLPYGTQEEVTYQWLENVNHAKKVAEAQNLYCGRGFVESLLAAKIANTEPWIISAGLGLVHARDNVPAYNLTITPATHNSIQQRVTTPFCPTSWWTALNKERKRSLSTLIKEHSRSIVLLSLSQAYAKMVYYDLLQLDDLALSRLRIVGLACIEILPKRLQRAYMPYDMRLNDPELGIPGTMADFPQRATRHFVERIWLGYPTSGAIEHAALVENSLSALKQPVIPKRRQMTDEEITKVIINQWDQAEGKSSKMLRLLRSKLTIACEQKRFSFLFNQVKEGIERG